MNAVSKLRGVGHRVAVSASAIVAAAGLVLMPTVSARADSFPPAGSVQPSQDPFYQAPANIGGYAPGQVVATRPVTDSVFSNVDAWQIAYRTNDAHDLPELAVTTLLVPQAAWTAGGARPVVSLGWAEDSTGTQCAPSYQIASKGYLGVAFGSLFVNPLLGKNWAVAVPDFEGPKSEFMVGPQAGHAVLDGIRAVRSVRLGGIGQANAWALDGYSGGSNATGWAAQMQPSYAPDVTLVGAAMGGTPADPKAVAQYIDGGLFSGFEAAATASLVTEYGTEMNYLAIASAQGKADLVNAEGKCLDQLITQFAFKKIADDATIPNPLDYPPIAAVLRTNTMGGAAPATPIFDYHATGDEIVPVGQDDTLAHTWCAMGVSVQIGRDPIGEHVSEFAARQNDVLNFLTDRFDGKAATSTC